jgi:hypothetical protein
MVIKLNREFSTKQTMTKLQGHIVVGIFDIAAIGFLYWLYVSHVELTNALANQANIVSFNNRIYFLGAAVLIPLVHVIAVLEAIKPQVLTKRIKTGINYFLVGTLVIFLVLPFVLTHRIESMLAKRSYYYCDEASFHGTVSNTLVYVKNPQMCSKDIDI